MTTLKKQLKAHGKTYADVAELLQLSEASVKRLFAEQSFTLKRLERIFRTILLSLFCLPVLDVAAAPAGTLKSDKVKGLSRYCVYTDGAILTIEHTDLCPRKNPNPTKSGSPPSVNIERKGGPSSGPLKGQKIKGGNRYCSYSDGTVLTVDKQDKCPNKSR